MAVQDPGHCHPILCHIFIEHVFVFLGLAFSLPSSNFAELFMKKNNFFGGLSR